TAARNSLTGTTADVLDTTIRTPPFCPMKHDNPAGLSSAGLSQFHSVRPWATGGSGLHAHRTGLDRLPRQFRQPRLGLRQLPLILGQVGRGPGVIPFPGPSPLIDRPLQLPDAADGCAPLPAQLIGPPPPLWVCRLRNSSFAA